MYENPNQNVTHRLMEEKKLLIFCKKSGQTPYIGGKTKYNDICVIAHNLFFYIFFWVGTCWNIMLYLI